MRQRDGVGLCVCTTVGAGLCDKGSVNNLLLVVADARPHVIPVPLSCCTCPPLFECGLFRLEVPRPPIFSATKNSEANECPAAFRKGEKHNERKRLVALSSLLHALTLLYHSTKFFLFHSPCL